MFCFVLELAISLLAITGSATGAALRGLEEEIGIIASGLDDIDETTGDSTLVLVLLLLLLL